MTNTTSYNYKSTEKSNQYESKLKCFRKLKSQEEQTEQTKWAGNIRFLYTGESRGNPRLKINLPTCQLYSFFPINGWERWFSSLSIQQMLHMFKSLRPERWMRYRSVQTTQKMLRDSKSSQKVTFYQLHS